ALSDVLASEARSRRGDIDAAGIAVEEGLTDGLTSGSTSPADAIAALAARGLSAEMAEATVRRWAAALGANALLVGSTQQIPTTPRDDDATVVVVADEQRTT